MPGEAPKPTPQQMMVELGGGRPVLVSRPVPPMDAAVVQADVGQGSSAATPKPCARSVARGCAAALSTGPTSRFRRSRAFAELSIREIV